jgi:hypothetical protein
MKHAELPSVNRWLLAAAVAAIPTLVPFVVFPIDEIGRPLELALMFIPALLLARGLIWLIDLIVDAAGGAKNLWWW